MHRHGCRRKSDDPVGDLYIFNLSTAGLSAGTYQIAADLGDGDWRTVLVSLKK